MRIKRLAVSPLTNRIYYGTLDTGKSTFVGDKTDLTETAIAAVFQWFTGELENNENAKEYIIRYPESECELVMRKKPEKDVYLNITDVKHHTCNVDLEEDIEQL